MDFAVSSSPDGFSVQLDYDSLHHLCGFRGPLHFGEPQNGPQITRVYAAIRKIMTNAVVSSVWGVQVAMGRWGKLSWGGHWLLGIPGYSLTPAQGTGSHPFVELGPQGCFQKSPLGTGMC